MRDFAIVAIGYNRAPSMYRLLHSVGKACYQSDTVDLIVSIDCSGTDDVEQCAKAFEWSHGEKIIRTFPVRQGLRNHILSCGDYLKQYRAIAVLEDDVLVSPGFYAYMKEAVQVYENDENIAGISLYNHLWNVNANAPFQPAYAQFDAYFFQFAQSWGQVWMKKQWFAFADWYQNNSEAFGAQDNMPAFVSGWPQTSWLKYHIKYCVEQNKYFVYPYKSLSTCYSDVGTHVDCSNAVFQVPLLYDVKHNYHFPQLDENAVRYDAFFERMLGQGAVQDISFADVCVNIHGEKNAFEDKRYMLSIQPFPYQVIASFSLDLRPVEMNFLQEIEGDVIRLYDTSVACDKPKQSKQVVTCFYFFRLYGNLRALVRCVAVRFVNKIKEKIRYLKKKYQ